MALLKHLNLAAAAALIGALGACAQTGATETAAAPAPQQAAQPASYSDAQLRAFIEARNSIDPISSGLANATPEQREAATAQITAILEANNLTPDQYNAIIERSRTDQPFANRIAGLTPNTFTAAQLRAFVLASAEINPINTGLASASEAEREAATAQIRAILERHGIDANDYNAIAARAQNDAELAARISAVHAEMQAEAEAEAEAETETE